MILLLRFRSFFTQFQAEAAWYKRTLEALAKGSTAECKKAYSQDKDNAANPNSPAYLVSDVLKAEALEYIAECRRTNKLTVYAPNPTDDHDEQSKTKKSKPNDPPPTRQPRSAAKVANESFKALAKTKDGQDASALAVPNNDDTANEEEILEESEGDADDDAVILVKATANAGKATPVTKPLNRAKHDNKKASWVHLFLHPIDQPAAQPGTVPKQRLRCILSDYHGSGADHPETISVNSRSTSNYRDHFENYHYSLFEAMEKASEAGEHPETTKASLMKGMVRKSMSSGSLL